MTVSDVLGERNVPNPAEMPLASMLESDSRRMGAAKTKETFFRYVDVTLCCV